MKNRAGMSLVEILVSFGVMMILISGISAMTINQQKETRALSEKLAALDLEKLLISSLSDGSICTAELASTVFHPSAYVINTTQLNQQTISLPNLHASSTSGAAYLTETNQPVSAMASQLLVDTIKFQNFTSTGPADNYFVDLQVAFKNGVRPLKPVTIKMIVKTNPTDPPNAKTILSCLETGHTGNSFRYAFTTSQTWTVPPGVKSALVTMAGGGGSGAGWRVVNAVYSGHSGGYVFSHPVNLVPGEVLSIVIGQGGKSFQTVNTGVLANPGPPYYIFTSPSGDDGLGGYPGTATKLISPTMGTLLECDGGSGASYNGVDAYNGSVVAGDVPGATVGGGSPPYPSPQRNATGPYATPNGPGACGPNGYGIGNAGNPLWGVSSGFYPGGTTPFGYGAGGTIYRMGCYVNATTIGTCVNPADGRDGVVYIDVWQ
ncbi:MAG: type IV pilus modification PilV family protein [Bdellovibrio sp.]